MSPCLSFHVPTLTITNLTTSPFTIQDPSGVSGLSFVVAGGATVAQVVTNEQLGALTPLLASAATSGYITWTGTSVRRMNVVIPPLTTQQFNTGIRQLTTVNDPTLGSTPTAFDLPPFEDLSGGVFTSEVLVPAPGTLPASRVMVIPLSPIRQWVDVDMPTEPYFNPDTNTVWITLANTHASENREVNVLVWDPFPTAGPVTAATYTTLNDPNA